MIRFKKPLIVMNKQPEALVAKEQYRILCTRMKQIQLAHSHTVFCLTSAVKGEGKSVTSLNTAYLMAAEYKKKVLLMECDLKRPSLLSYFADMNPQKGLPNVITGEVTYKSVIFQVENSSCYLLPTVKRIENSSHVLGLPGMASLLKILKKEFDFIIIDSPPILSVADMNIIAKQVDGVLLLVRAGKTPKEVVVRAANSLETGNIVGIVLNSTDTLLQRYNYNYSYYY